MDIIWTIHAKPVKTAKSIKNAIINWREKYLFIIVIVPSIKPKSQRVNYVSVSPVKNASRDKAMSNRTAIILEPSVPGSGNTEYDPTEKTWKATFSYGTVSGVASCNNTAGSSNSTAHPEYNSTFTQATTGTQCWCRMTSPVRSAWVYDGPKDNAATCETNCAYNCTYYVNNSASFRTAMYTTAGN